MKIVHSTCRYPTKEMILLGLIQLLIQASYELNHILTGGRIYQVISTDFCNVIIVDVTDSGTMLEERERSFYEKLHGSESSS